MKIRLLTAAAVTIVIASLAISAPAANANPKQPKVHVHFEGAVVQFTDCPATLPPVDIICRGSEFQMIQVDTHVGSQHDKFADIHGGVANITLHPDGTFDTSAPIAVGQLVVKRADMGGLDRARINGIVPLSDGTNAVIDVTLIGQGDENSFTFPNLVVSQPLCPDGLATVTINRDYRSVSSVGTLTFHGVTQVPVDVVQPAFLLQERDKGTCTSP